MIEALQDTQAWSEVAVEPNLGPLLRVDGQTWASRGALAPLSEANTHPDGWAITDASDVWRSKQTHRYPGGARVQDRGLEQEGGRASFPVTRLAASPPLIVLSRMLVRERRPDLSVWADARPVGTIPTFGAVNRQTPWRNLVFRIDGAHVPAERMTLQLEPVGARAICHFRYDFYQPAAEAPFVLHYHDDQGTRRHLTVSESAPVSIGSGPQATLSVSDRFLAPTHAHFVVREGALYVSDASGSSGTYVNGASVTSCPLGAYDVVWMGRFSVTLHPNARGA